MIPNQRILLANYPSGGAASFKTLSLVTDQDLTEGDIRLADSLGISLWDSAGAIVIEDTFGILHDRMNYGEYFGLDARNAYVATASLGNLGDREPMQAVYRTAGLARPVGGTTPQVLVITTTGTMVGEVSLSPLPTGYNGSETGTYALERGGTAYEFTSHLGNVLAVVSDKKLGQGGTTLEPFSTYYHPDTRLLTDYYPFGMAMVGRTWQSGGYRYGFNGMQKDNEVVGEANGYDFGARLYDGRVGRWWSVDRFFEYYRQLSSYQFVGNNPLNSIDSNGDSIIIVGLAPKEAKEAYMVMMQTPNGREILEKYYYSSEVDVYIGFSKYDDPDAIARTTPVDMTPGIIVNGKIDVFSNGEKANFFEAFQGVDVSGSLKKNREIALIIWDIPDMKENDKYTNAQTVFHEMWAHIENAQTFMPPSLNRWDAEHYFFAHTKSGRDPEFGTPGYDFLQNIEDLKRGLNENCNAYEIQFRPNTYKDNTVIIESK